MPSIQDDNKVKFILSIDTEEEWNWDSDYPQDDCSVENINYLPEFHSAITSLGVRPTYFVDYAVAHNSNSAQTLKGLHDQNNCEIGAHLHPWCNPPYDGVTEDFESHVVNLPIELVEQKLDQLTQIISDKIGPTPTSFRTGRWGINQQVMSLLVKKGFLVDSSVFPFYSNSYFSCDDAHGLPYWPDLNDVLSPGLQNDIYEVPVTAGFNRQNFAFWNKVHRGLSAQPWSSLKLIGMLWHTKLLKKIYLSPELASKEDMIELVDTALARGHRHIHMFFHSSSLLPNAACFENQDKSDALNGVISVVDHLRKRYDVEFDTVSECRQDTSN